MLNKDLCKKCFITVKCSQQPFVEQQHAMLQNFMASQPQYFGNFHLHFKEETKNDFEKYFEMDWEMFYCFCPYFKSKSGILYISQDPPTNCPYILEQSLFNPSWFYRFKVKLRAFFKVPKNQSIAQ
jgi:hypothetical protein